MTDTARTTSRQSRRRRWMLRVTVVVVGVMLVVLGVVQVILWSDLPRQVVVAQVERRLGLRVSAEGFVDERIFAIEVRSGEVTRGIEFRLRRAGSMRGRVVEAGAGAPIPGAEVGWLPDGVEKEFQGPVGKAVSMPDGSFTLTGVEPGRVRLAVSGEDLPATKAGPFEVRAGETVEGIVLAVSRGGGVDGHALASPSQRGDS